MASFEKRNSGWTVKFRVTENGVEIQKRLSGFDTKKAAAKACQEYMLAHDQKSDSMKGSIRFEAVYDEYFRYCKSNSKESSYIGMHLNAGKNVLPFFKNMKVEDITPVIVTNWFNSLPLKYASKQENLRLLKIIMNYGARVFDYNNPLVKLTPIKDNSGIPKQEMQIWSPEELNQFLSVIDDDVYRLFFKFLYLSGCRKGEALALSWDDFTGNTIHIYKQVSFITEDENGWRITSPKTASSDRYLSFPAAFIAELETIHKHQGLVFSRDGKKPLLTRTVDIRFAKYIRLSGVKKIRIHDLRHSCASYLISSGLPITAVSKRLGHSSVTITLSRYSHMLKSDETKIIDALQNI